MSPWPDVISYVASLVKAPVNPSGIAAVIFAEGPASPKVPVITTSEEAALS